MPRWTILANTFLPFDLSCMSSLGKSFYKEGGWRFFLTSRGRGGGLSFFHVANQIFRTPPRILNDHSLIVENFTQIINISQHDDNTVLKKSNTYHILKKFPFERNGPNDLNKMISKVYWCKMGQGEWQVFS